MAIWKRVKAFWKKNKPHGTLIQKAFMLLTAAAIGGSLGSSAKMPQSTFWYVITMILMVVLIYFFAKESQDSEDKLTKKIADEVYEKIKRK